MSRMDDFQGSTAPQGSGLQQNRRLQSNSSRTALMPDVMSGVPRFKPARGLESGHAQTIWGTIFPGRVRIPGTMERRLRLDDGDLVVLHDNCPPTWHRGDHAVLLMHGLCGSHRSGYMVRLANRLNSQRVRAFRLDHRGCGSGFQLARNPYHAGRIDDIAAAVQMVERLCPGSPISLVGYSMSGNLLLRYLGEQSHQLPMSLFRAVAVCPPIDLNRCAAKLNASRMGQRYDWYFTRKLISQISNSPQWKDHLPLASARRAPRRLYDFDELYTAPASGFESADDYYMKASAFRHIDKIRVHTTILASDDDPVVCPTPFRELALPPNVNMCLTRHGGHLGFIGRAGVDPDRRWMDWRVMDWLLT